MWALMFSKSHFVSPVISKGISNSAQNHILILDINSFFKPFVKTLAVKQNLYLALDKIKIN